MITIPTMQNKNIFYDYLKEKDDLLCEIINVRLRLKYDMSYCYHIHEISNLSTFLEIDFHLVVIFL